MADVSSLFYQRPEKLNEKPSVLPAVEVIAPGGSYNPDFFSHQVTHLDTAAPLYSNGAKARLRYHIVCAFCNTLMSCFNLKGPRVFEKFVM